MRLFFNNVLVFVYCPFKLLHYNIPNLNKYYKKQYTRIIRTNNSYKQDES